MNLREIAGREIFPAAGIIGRRSGHVLGRGGPCGYGAGRKAPRRKRRLRTE